VSLGEAERFLVVEKMLAPGEARLIGRRVICSRPCPETSAPARGRPRFPATSRPGPPCSLTCGERTRGLRGRAALPGALGASCSPSSSRPSTAIPPTTRCGTPWSPPPTRCCGREALPSTWRWRRRAGRTPRPGDLLPPRRGLRPEASLGAGGGRGVGEPRLGGLPHGRSPARFRRRPGPIRVGSNWGQTAIYSTIPRSRASFCLSRANIFR
jgi:hypothetical protein